MWEVSSIIHPHCFQVTARLDDFVDREIDLLQLRLFRRSKRYDPVTAQGAEETGKAFAEVVVGVPNPLPISCICVPSADAVWVTRDPMQKHRQKTRGMFLSLTVSEEKDRICRSTG
jgi:hypothetical protein